MERSNPCGVLRFGNFELDVAAYELRGSGRLIRLERQPMDLLIMLVERRGQLVSREDIVERLWAGTSLSTSTLACTKVAPDLCERLGCTFGDHRGGSTDDAEPVGVDLLRARSRRR
jgi:hypothetical protein